MNTSKLTKHYPNLSPTERFSLLLSAVARGDEVEQSRLGSAAARVAFTVSDTAGPALAFLGTFTFHRLEHLELIALYNHARGAADSHVDHEGPVSNQLDNVARLFAYTVKIKIAGWKLFCARKGLDSSLFEGEFPGQRAFAFAAESIEHDAFTEDEVRAEGQVADPPVAAVKTAEIVAKELTTLYETLLVKCE